MNENPNDINANPLLKINDVRENSIVERNCIFPFWHLTYVTIINKTMVREMQNNRRCNF